MKQNIFDEFKRLTGKDIFVFFQDCIDFFRSDYNQIVEFYNGRLKEIDSGIFSRFEELNKEKSRFFASIQSTSTQMRDTRWWDLIETLEEIDNRFSTLSKIYKWTRSSATSFGYTPNIILDYQLSQFETLEKVSKSVIKDSNPQDDWVDIALDNQLEEEDYTYLGGTRINVQLSSRINLGIVVDSVVDVLQGKSIYGKDLQSTLEFSSTDSEGDLVVLDYNDTLQQSVETLIDLRKNDNPDFPEHGLQKSVVAGSNRALLNFPVISRQLSETFATDDTLKEFRILNMSLEQDNLIVDFDVKTRLNEIESGSMSL